MTSRDFCYWLQGYFEISKAPMIGFEEADIVKRHLALVFLHEIDPEIPDPKRTLQATHDGTHTPGKTAAEQTVYRC